MAAKPLLVPSPNPHVLRMPISASFPFVTPALTLLTDLATLSLVFGVAVAWRHALTPAYSLRSYIEMLPCLGMLIIAFAVQGLYPGTLLHKAEEMRRVFVSICTVFLLMGAATFLWHNAQSYSRSVFLVCWAAGAPLVLFTRYALRQLIGHKPWWGVSAVVLGSGTLAHRVVRKLQDGTLGLRVTATFSDDPVESWPSDLTAPTGTLDTSNWMSIAHKAQYCIVALPKKTNAELRHVIQDYCHGFRHVLLVPDMPGLCSLGISARELGGELGLELPQHLFHKGAASAKRVIDTMLATFALLLSSPIFALIALAIRCTSRGPILYGQTRQGQDGVPFKALKFRTMVKDSDTVLSNYLAQHPDKAIEWTRNHKLKADPRVTAVGRLLRRLSLDELPQLLNILVGQMSLVGPRPIVKAEIDKYGRGYELYSRVRPGLTGLWQVSGRSNTTYAERVTFDEYYVRNWSIWLDAYILVKTVKVVLTAEGAY